ncbi:MAG: carbohydrate kinase family protein [Actinobacteria bacterium]|nr:carbohydrate kinase family protein [Actinomycetota bacterium]
MRVVTLGDLILDVVVRLDEPLAPGADRVAETRVGAGGQAANVAAWAAALGADARYVGKRGADAAGELATRELAAHGVEVAGPVEGRNGVVVSIAAAADRTMASDRGSAVELRADELDPNWFRCDALHVSGYALHREPMAAAAVLAADTARHEGARVSVDLGAWTGIDDAFRARLAELAPDLLFADERERDALGPFDASWVVKRGADGIVVDGSPYAALPVDVVDTTGAGDALAAGFLVGGPGLGLEAARRCCAKLGAMP